jgi:hypothetical protein
MWLLDANMDVHLLSLFSELGIPCESSIDRGWRELTNGQLVAAAVEAGFTCILTHDRLFAESASSSTRSAQNLGIIVVHLPQMPWREYVQRFRLAWSQHPVVPSPGSVIHWPPDRP